MAQLIDVKTDERLWSETFDRELTDIFAVQSEVALEISRVLQAQLTSSETANINKPVNVDTKVYDNLLKARTYSFCKISALAS